MGVDSSDKGGMPDGMSPAGQDQWQRPFKDKGRKVAAATSAGALLRTHSAGLLGEDERDVQKDVVAHARHPVNARDVAHVGGKSSTLVPEDGKKKLSAGTVRAGMPAGFSFNAAHVIRGPEPDALDCESNHETSSVGSQDLRTRGAHRAMLGSLPKPTPSKWDDAEKWLPALAAAGDTPTRTKAKSGPLQGHLVTTHYPALLQKKGAFANAVGRQHAAVNGAGGKMATLLSSASQSVTSGSSDALSSGDDLTTTGEDSGQSSDQPPRPSFERTKKVDTKYSTSHGDAAGAKFTFMPITGPTVRESTVDRYSLTDVSARAHASKPHEASLSSECVDENFSKPTLRTEKPTSDGCLEDEGQADSSTYDSAAVTVRSVCMRDMGTEMTPIASQQPSRAGTPLAATTPTLGSPSASRSTTPQRAASKSSNSAHSSSRSAQSMADGESKATDLSDKELQVRTRQEILALGAQLGKTNVTAWATKDMEDANGKNSSSSAYTLEEVRKNALHARAATWEEAERSKYLARYAREESRILAWENHEKAKAEAQLRRVEVEIERMRSRANEKLMCKLAAARRRAEEMRAAAEAQRAEQAAQIAQRGDRIRLTGKVPGSIFPGLCCS